jgi:hypothetical protein
MLLNEVRKGAGVSLPGAAQSLLAEADQLLAESSRRGLVLRLAGSAGVLRHCPACRRAVGALNREPPDDLDFFAYGKQQRELGRMFADLGYRPDPAVAFSQEYGIDRLIYTGHASAAKIDVFLDVLRMSHTIEFKSRLGSPEPAAAPTATTADLLLAKLQIHEITEKDVKDMAALFASHPLGDGSHGSIESRHIVGLMARDWGLCYTALDNLALAEELLAAWDPGGNVTVLAAEGIQELRQRIELAPKSLRWKARARVGTRVRWYEEVGDAQHQGQGDAGIRER